MEKPNILDVQNAVGYIAAGAAEYVQKNPEGPNWYPCGFAWVTYKCRKNAKEAGSLIARGFRWDDYEKVYTLSAYKFANTQSMDYQESVLRAGVAAAARHYPNIHFGIRTRID